MRDRVVSYLSRYRWWVGAGLLLLCGGIGGGLFYVKRPQAVTAVGEYVRSVVADVPIAVPTISPSVSPGQTEKNTTDVQVLRDGLVAVQEGYARDAAERQELSAKFNLLSTQLEEQRKLLQAKAATLDAAVAGINTQIAALNGQPLPSVTAQPGSAVTPLPAASQKISINKATASELDSLPGIGPATADKIIAYRTEHGPFASVDNLADVSGISMTMVDKMRDLIEI